MRKRGEGTLPTTIINDNVNFVKPYKEVKMKYITLGIDIAIAVLSAWTIFYVAKTLRKPKEK